MTEFDQIKNLEALAIKYAEKNIPDAMWAAITQMFIITDKVLGYTNEYKEDIKE